MNGLEMRLPDTILRQVFSHLDFSNIASCRLVSTQWHRFALDSFSFVLFLQNLEQRNPKPSKPRRSQQKAVFSVAAADDSSNWFVQAKLVPYPAWLDWKAAEKKALTTNRCIDRNEPPEWISFDQLVAVIESSFERKIKHVVIKTPKVTISSILPALTQMAPAATTISAFNHRDWTTKFGTTRFARQRPDDDFKCLELHMDAVVLDKNDKKADYRPVSDSAGFIVRLSTSNWRHVQTAIDCIERNNDGSGNDLVFNSCEELLVEQSPPSTAKPFQSIAGHFPALRKLDYAIAGFGATLDFEPLEQLPNLKSLIVRNESFGSPTLLPKLRFPGLVELRLGNNILLPEDQLNLFLPALTTLQLEAGIKNAWRLSEFCVPVLSNLAVLTTTKLPANIARPFLRSVLPVALKLQSLTIDLRLTNQLGRPVLTDIYDTLVAVPSCKAALTLGTFCIFPEAVDCRSLVQQRVADIKERSLKTPITVSFKDNANSALVKTLSEADAGGQEVVISATIDDSESNGSKSYELVWHNNVAGIQQKLKIQVSA